MTVLVTGASGFVGTILRQKINSVPFDIDGGPVDLRNFEDVKRALETIRPEAVIHLAAQSWVPQSFKDPQETFDVNFGGTFHLLAGLRELAFNGRVLFVSSSDVYGLISPNDLPATESLPARPRSPYAVSKVAAEALCFQWNQTENFDIVIARPFVHIGPGQADHFVVSNFARQIIEIKKGQREPVVAVGDIAVTRDFTDVHDVIRSYQLLLQKGSSGEIYNICSGVERSVESLLAELLALSGVKAEIRRDPERFRKSEQRRVVGDCQKLRKHTGWSPEIPLRQTLQSVLTYWEGIL